MNAVVEVVAVVEDGPTVTIKGRYARCLHTLIHAGEQGVSPATDDPMPRWSHYVYWLRKHFNIVIETVTEKHGGPYAGTHARYVLRSRVSILKVIHHGETRDAA